MDTRYLPYVLEDEDFYDRPGVHGEEIVVDVAPGVAVQDSGPWRSYRAGRGLPASGWKVHVACRPEDAAATASVVVTACLSRGIVCKHLRSVGLVAATQGKYADLAQAGKVITVYPRDEAELAGVVSELSVLLAETPGAHPPGDVPIHGTPLSLRYGAFTEAWGLDDAGTVRPARLTDVGLVLDPRESPATLPAPSPTVIRAQEERERFNVTARLELTEVSLLHRSNAGGVYRGLWQGRRPVVAKEARHHTGFDASWTDARTRLRHEARALERLGGTGIAPELVDLVTVGASDFLVMTEVPGNSLAGHMALTHPGGVVGADPEAYGRWLDRTGERLDALLSVLHDRGVCHGDLHAANVMDDGERLVLIDFESAAIDGHVVASGVASPLSHVDAASPEEADRVALSRLKESLINPLLSLTVRRPDLRGPLLASGLRDLGRPPGPSDGLAEHPVMDVTPEWSADRRRSLVDGILGTATPARDDRLFPGDIHAFTQPRGGVGLLHGALGVLRALAEEQVPARPEWVGWLRRALDGDVPWAAGMDSGAEGVGLACAHLGLRDEAEALLSVRRPTSPVPWWAQGAAGQSVALADAAACTGRSELVEDALRHVHALGPLLEAGTAPGYAPGLVQGWAGVALALLRVAEVLVIADERREARALRAVASAAVRKELEAAHWTRGALLMRSGPKLFPYLGNGSAAIGLAASALLPFAATEERHQLTRIRDGVLEAVRLPLVAGCGLLHGRAGLAATARRLTSTTDAWHRHLSRLSWHTLAPRRGVADHEQDRSVELVLGDQNLRCSTDLGTGAAGVVLALGDCAQPASSGTPLDRVLALPECRPEAGVDARM